MQALDADKCILSRHKMQVALLAEPKTPLVERVYMSTQGGVGQDHMCAIIAVSLMSTSNEMCGAFFVHNHEALLYTQALSVTHARISLPHA